MARTQSGLAAVAAGQGRSLALRWVTLVTLAAVSGLSLARMEPSRRTLSAAPSPFRLVGYVTDTGIMPLDAQIAALTHINYAFALPAADGGLRGIGNEWKLRDIVARARARDVKTLISIGGWGTDAEFEALAAAPEARARFVRETRAFVDAFQLDGADIDWEYPDPDPTPNHSAANFSALMAELAAVLHPDGKLLTMAVVGRGAYAQGIHADALAAADFVNIMAYDGGPGAEHSPYAYAEAALDVWAQRGLPASKRVLGVPFYARPGDIPYQRIALYGAEAREADQFEFAGREVFYNGAPTLRRKVALARERGSGIMIWQIGFDTTDETSLLSVIAEAARR